MQKWERPPKTCWTTKLSLDCSARHPQRSNKRGYSMISADEVIRTATEETFGKPLVVNVLRSILVQAMVAMALPKTWRWCSADYASHDFIHETGVRLEVKQSAARQSWPTASGKVGRGSFDIAPRTGFWVDGATWMPKPGRNADVYVFAFHPVTDDNADHREPEQWEFYVAPTAKLPDGKTLALSRVRQFAQRASIQELPSQVENARQSLRNSQT